MRARLAILLGCTVALGGCAYGYGGYGPYGGMSVGVGYGSGYGGYGYGGYGGCYDPYSAAGGYGGYDYYGFPEHTYHVRYGAPGSPALAARVQDLLRAGGLPATSDPDRGFDHGTFSIMKPLYPDEDLPIVQLSLDASLDPALHLQVGRLLAPLREEGVLIIGSGSSFHNLRMRDARAIAPSKQFDDWLQHTLVGSSPGARP